MAQRTTFPCARGPGRRAAVLLVVWAAAGCHSLVDPPLPSGAVAFTPPAVYARWWAMTEACAGRSRPLGEISWFVVPEAMTFPNGSAGEANGSYANVTGRIVLAGRYQLDATVVRHEMLHALLRGQPGHSRAAFLERCAGVVACGPACVRDAGPAPVAPAGTPTVPLSTVRVSAELAPTVPSASGDGGWYTLTVTATNPSATAVVVAAPAYAATFGYQLTPNSPTKVPVLGLSTAILADVPVYDAGAWQFGAGEVKQYVFDLHAVARPEDVPDNGYARGDTRVLAGGYMVVGSFGGYGVGPSAPAVAVTVAP